MINTLDEDQIQEILDKLENVKINRSNIPILKFILKYIENHSYLRSRHIAENYVESRSLIRYREHNQKTLARIIGGYFSLLIKKDIIEPASRNNRAYLFKTTPELKKAIEILLECEYVVRSNIRKLENRLKK